ncbi:MAG: signal recognition particle-docking protein FtsY [Proteobacteria bacterium]|nr:signal recognition particle-docking protein FtsY [Pseudomonadota bacterium]
MLGWFKRKLITKHKDAESEKAAVASPQVVTADEHAVESVPAQSQPPVVKGTEESFSKPGLLGRLKEQLAKTRDSFVTRVDELFLGKKVIDRELLDDLEEVLISADLGVDTVMDLLEDARERLSRKELDNPQTLRQALKVKMLEFLSSNDLSREMSMPENEPFVIMVTGVNGVGKTTSIGKIAHKFKQAGRSVLLVAGDTFRAAAVDQLKIWGERVGVEVVSQKTGSDPSSVVYDALDHAKAKKYDVVLIDTAGRMHTKVNLMEELRKIKRVISKKIPGAPHEVMLVIDATTGQNGISQARLFNEVCGLTGLTLTKLDGTAKGGIVVNICREFNIPIRFIGIGEQMDDLRDFDASEFVDALFSE